MYRRWTNGWMDGYRMPQLLSRYPGVVYGSVTEPEDLMRETCHLQNSARQVGSLLEGDKLISTDFSRTGKIKWHRSRVQDVLNSTKPALSQLSLKPDIRLRLDSTAVLTPIWLLRLLSSGLSSRCILRVRSHHSG